MAARWFQFSLRGFLLTVSLAGIAVGWKVESTHRRSRAINALASAGHSVWYSDSRLHGRSDLRSDWIGTRVNMTAEQPYSADVGRTILAAMPIGRLEIVGGRVDDVGLGHLYGLNKGCHLKIYGREIFVSQVELNKFKQRHPNVQVEFITSWGSAP